MKVSIIVPIYKGEKYINGIIKMVKDNYEYIKQNGADYEIELIFVNDYPAHEINIMENATKEQFDIKVVTNKVNQGIHQSRINGIKEAKGKIILMLDQDDLISDDCIYSQMNCLKESDIVVGNGYKMTGNRKKNIYNNINKQKLATKKKYYLYAANQIISPGHCLIKKEAIPLEWYEYVITESGGDDLFLWILMFENKKKFVINTNKVYTHVDTGENFSLNLNKMYKSSDNVIEMFRQSESVSSETINIYQRRIAFLRQLQNKSKIIKFMACIRNIDICLYKLFAYYR